MNRFKLSILVLVLSLGLASCHTETIAVDDPLPAEIRSDAFFHVGHILPNGDFVLDGEQEDFHASFQTAYKYHTKSWVEIDKKSMRLISQKLGSDTEKFYLACVGRDVNSDEPIALRRLLERKGDEFIFYNQTNPDIIVSKLKPENSNVCKNGIMEFRNPDNGDPFPVYVCGTDVYFLDNRTYSTRWKDDTQGIKSES